MALKWRPSVHQKVHEDIAELREPQPTYVRAKSLETTAGNTGAPLSQTTRVNILFLFCPPTKMCSTLRQLWANPWSSQGLSMQRPGTHILFYCSADNYNRYKGLTYTEATTWNCTEFYSRFCLCFEWEDSLRPEPDEEKKANLTSTRANFSSLV